MSHAGRFVWRELVTPTPTDTTRFYAHLFGWTVRDVDMGFPYTMLHHDALDEDVGGALAPQAPGVPAHWVDYISVDDVDAAVAQAESMGGTIVSPAVDIPVGRFALLQDPAGATFAVFRGEPGASDTERHPPLGTFCWSQLMSDRVDDVVPFYTALFGWDAVAREDGAVWFMDGTTPRASAVARPADEPGANHWLAYVAVPEVEAAFARAQALGARPFVTPTEVPDMGRFAVLSDPSGAVFALWTHAS